MKIFRFFTADSKRIDMKLNNPDDDNRLLTFAAVTRPDGGVALAIINRFV